MFYPEQIPVDTKNDKKETDAKCDDRTKIFIAEQRGKLEAIKQNKAEKYKNKSREHLNKGMIRSK